MIRVDDWNEDWMTSFKNRATDAHAVGVLLKVI
jgi:hypothetical protein